MPNLLAAESSPYLKSAAHQPVHWLPWGDAAFARARAEDKPVLLDIGAVWCHWCHVMDGESYEDAATADILNNYFVCIKVDRDERPDVDIRYQRAVQALTGQGGWPLTAFLTSEGDVFFGGTYFPPEGNHFGRPGLPTILRHVARLYREDREKVKGSALAIRQHVVTTLDETRRGAPDAGLLATAADQVARLFDVRYGGFGTAPKFPHAAACEFLLSRWHDTRLDWQRDIVEKTLSAMARGGIHDHVGGGFHRYSVDERWIVPHFEKMSYDNSELLRAYCSAHAAFGSALYREVANGIVNWVLEILSDAERGAFFTSQDADLTFGDDGDYWTWTVDEVKAALGDDALAGIAIDFFGLDDPGSAMHLTPDRHVLYRALTLDEVAARTGQSVDVVHAQPQYIQPCVLGCRLDVVLPRRGDRLRRHQGGGPLSPTSASDLASPRGQPPPVRAGGAGGRAGPRGYGPRRPRDPALAARRRPVHRPRRPRLRVRALGASSHDGEPWGLPVPGRLFPHPAAPSSSTPRICPGSRRSGHATRSASTACRWCSSSSPPCSRR